MTMNVVHVRCLRMLVLEAAVLMDMCMRLTRRFGADVLMLMIFVAQVWVGMRHGFVNV